MAGVKERAEQVIAANFPNSLPNLRIIPASGALGGWVLWEGFEDKDQVQRQQELRSVLRENLTKEEQRELTAIFTLTPFEYESIMDDSVDEE